MLFPELALTGYPPEDLLLREHFLSDTGARCRSWRQRRRDRGDRRLPRADRGRAADTRARIARPVETVLYNAAAVLADGSVQAVYRKVHLPNYGVFDEQRYFKAGDRKA